jgi:hypothetical protein
VAGVCLTLYDTSGNRIGWLLMRFSQISRKFIEQEKICLALFIIIQQVNRFNPSSRSFTT